MASCPQSPAEPTACEFVLSEWSLAISDSLVEPSPECNICNEHYNDDDEDLIPRNLECGHSFCSKCILRCIQMNGQVTENGLIVMTCPNKCGKQTIVGEKSVQDLPKNWGVIDIVRGRRERSSTLTRNRSPSVGSRHHLDLNNTITTQTPACDVCESSGAVVVCPSCIVSLCQTCCDDIHKRKGYDVHSLVPINDFMNSIESLHSESSSTTDTLPRVSGLEQEEKQCKAHPGESIEFLCEVCCEEVCRLCLLTSGEHKDHEHRLLADLALEKREALRQMIDEVNDCHAEWNKGFDECHELKEQLYIKQHALESTIKSHFHSVHSSLHAKEEYLLAVVRSEVDSRSLLLSSQADQLAKVCGIAKDLAEECEDLVPSNTSEVIREADHILAQAQQYVRSEQDTSPIVTGAIESDFTCEEELLRLVENLGQLRMAPARVENVEVKSTGVSELVVSWNPPPEPSPKPSTYLLEYSTGHKPYKMVYKGEELESVVAGCATEQEDTVHRFRVAAANSVGAGPFSRVVTFTQRKASFLWDPNLKHTKAKVTNNGYTVSIGQNTLWISAGTTTVLSHGQHYWEVVLDRYGPPSLSRKVVLGVVSSTFHHWHRPHGVIGIKTCPIGHRSWGLACGTAKKLSSGSTFLKSFGRKHDMFKEGDAVGILLDLDKHRMSFYRNGTPLGIEFSDISGPVIPAISFCRNKTLTLRFPPPPKVETPTCTITITKPQK